jgi:hypothetical protein
VVEIRERSGRRYAVLPPPFDHYPEGADAIVYVANTLYEWEDTHLAKKYDIRLFAGIQDPTLESVPDYVVTLNAASVAKKVIRMGDTVAAWLPPGFYTILIHPQGTQSFGANIFYVE